MSERDDHTTSPTGAEQGAEGGMRMPTTVYNFRKGDEVFVLVSHPDFIGVRLLDDPEDSTVLAIVEATCGVPGHERGDQIEIATDVIAFKILTVSHIRAIEWRDEEFAEPTGSSVEHDEEDDEQDEGEWE